MDQLPNVIIVEKVYLETALNPYSSKGCQHLLEFGIVTESYLELRTISWLNKENT
jgi:hypothetical protein